MRGSLRCNGNLIATQAYFSISGSETAKGTLYPNEGMGIVVLPVEEASSWKDDLILGPCKIEVNGYAMTAHIHKVLRQDGCVSAVFKLACIENDTVRLHNEQVESL